MKKGIDLKGWIVDFLRFRDSFTKSIVGLTERKDEVLVRYKDKNVLYIISPDLSEAIKKLEKGSFAIVTLNKKSNLNTMIQNWHMLAKDQNLTIYFVNPDSETEKKWIIRPHLHDKVADDDALRPGLESLFSTVDEI